MPDPRRKLLEAAYLIARYAPKKQGKYVGQAKVSWHDIKNLRQALADLNISINHWDSATELERLYGAFEESHERSEN
ncbi:hypothetical protein [Meiothermus taiwanensis]|uniref:hypothetical protein n=1 Tax=Meiothermus taiwanensis TaxID=172827 RepID=UPI00040584B6